MRRPTCLVLLGVFAIGAALPASAEFHSLANHIERRGDLERLWIPFFGAARFIVKLTSPDGVHDIKMAVFERKSTAGVNLDRIVKRHVDLTEWSPIVRSTTRDREDAYVFVKEKGKNVMVLVAAMDGSEVVVVEVELDPERFARELAGEGDFVSLATSR